MFAPSAWEKPCICRTLLKLGLPWPPRGPAKPAKSSGGRTVSCQVGGQYPSTPRRGRCSAWSCFSQAKVSHGDLWVQPNPYARATQRSQGSREVPDFSTATFLLAQRSWEVFWRAGYPPHPPSPLLADIAFAPLGLSAATFQRRFKQPSVHCFFDQVSFLSPSSPASLFV